MFQKLNWTHPEENKNMEDKKDYSKFYIRMIIILAILFVSTIAYNEYEMYQHLQKDLSFAKETGEFIVYEAEIISYCANESNLSNEELLSNFLRYKSDEIIKDTFNNGNGLVYDALEVQDE